MKKNIIILIMFLLFFTNIVSANFIGKSWNFITGADIAEIQDGEDVPVEQVIEETPIEEQVIEEETPIEEKSIDQQYQERKQEFYQENQAQDGSGDYNKQFYGENWCTDGTCCPDTICDDFERSTNGCPMDCQPELAQKFKDYTPSKLKLGSCLNEEVIDILMKKCESKEGIARKISDESRGCSRMTCSFSKEKGIFVSDTCLTEEESQQQSQACNELGLDTVVIPGKMGCAPRVQCKDEESSIRYGLDQEEYSQGKENFELGNLDSATILEIIMKLDSTKIKISTTQEKMLQIANYYEKEGDIERAEAYRKSSSKMDDLNSKMDERKEELRTAIESNSLDWSTIFRIKTELQYSIEGPLNEAINIILGIDAAQDEESLETLDCETNGFCFENYLRECTVDATFNPEIDVEIRILGIDENDYCGLYLRTPNGEGYCNVPDFSYATLSQEELTPYCDDSFQQISEQYNEEQMQEEEAISENLTEEIEPNQVGGKEYFCDISETCDCNEICDDFEDTYTCDDCVRFAQCGDGLCEPLVGEDDPNSQNYCLKDCNISEDNNIIV